MIIRACQQSRLAWGPAILRPTYTSRHMSTSPPETDAYVLTLLTDKPHHARMTEVRNQYFPKQLNKLAAHLTVFHALPGDKLDTHIIPVIEEVASTTPYFNITAAEPFKLGKRGIGVNVLHEEGANRAKQVRDSLQAPWRRQGFLTEQDAARTSRHFPHYTVMNKVDDEAERDKAFEELKTHFKPDRGVVEALGLYRYDRGWWRWVRRFEFVHENVDMS